MQTSKQPIKSTPKGYVRPLWQESNFYNNWRSDKNIDLTLIEA